MENASEMLPQVIAPASTARGVATFEIPLERQGVALLQIVAGK